MICSHLPSTHITSSDFLFLCLKLILTKSDFYVNFYFKVLAARGYSPHGWRWAKKSNRHVMYKDVSGTRGDQWQEKFLENPPTGTTHNQSYFPGAVGESKNPRLCSENIYKPLLKPAPCHFPPHFSGPLLFTLGCLFKLLGAVDHHFSGIQQASGGLITTTYKAFALLFWGDSGLGGCFDQEDQNQE